MIHHHGFLGRPGDQRGLERGNPGAVQDPRAESSDVLVWPIVAAVIRGAHPRLTRGPSRLAVHPQQHLRLGEPRFHLAVIALPGATALAVGGPREQGLRAVAGEVLGGVESACGRSQARDGSGGSRRSCRSP
jgi:hypothetical protein